MANAFFNANYYLAQNEDLVRAGLHTEEQLWDHYVNYGAQENRDGLNINRVPNTWFDVNYYLGSYPDLIAAGVTAAQALDHYFTYGINEGRQFNATIRTSDFTADDYAAENADVREALGIEEDAELTAQDKANLLKHYLAWGYAENREGAGTKFENDVNALNDVTVKANGAQGTIGNDLFVVNTDSGLTANAVIDGLGGDDTVRFEAATTEVGKAAVTLRSVENVVVDGVKVEANVESKLDSLKLEGAADATLNFAAAAVAGSDDVLNVATTGNATLTVNGFETVNVALGGKADTFTLNANKSAGSSQTVKLTGGNKDTSAELTFNNKGSSKLTDLTIDGSGLATGLDKVELTDEAQNIKNVVVKGSTSAANDFNVTVNAEKQSLTVIGGDKDDTFTATKAIETFTGGKGDDTFVFATADSAKVSTKTVDKKEVINGVDTITDFKKGDALDLGTVVLDKLTLVTGEEAGLKTLDDWVMKAAAGEGFNFNGDAYIVLATGATSVDASLIKLAGVNVDSFFKDGATQTNDDGNFIFA
ncbi:hypothetical protein ACBP82_01435 [Paenalcaligenes hominis]|uniref:hypothetical protein n=1 Tax=Paenalcaligenes hominis TaxID=643674 RepID=UPI003525B252